MLLVLHVLLRLDGLGTHSSVSTTGISSNSSSRSGLLVNLPFKSGSKPAALWLPPANNCGPGRNHRWQSQAAMWEHEMCPACPSTCPACCPRPAPPCSKLLHLCVPYNEEDLVWHPVTKQMNSPAFQVGPGSCRSHILWGWRVTRQVVGLAAGRPAHTLVRH